MKIEIKPFPRQAQAWNYLLDKTTTEIGYGGAGNGGKTWLGCEWVITQCLAYPKIAILIGRKELKNLKQTTQVTFFKALAYYGLLPNQHWQYDQQANVLKFANGSEVIWAELMYKPSDPMNAGLGGLELTHAWIDESAEINYSMVDTLRTRLGRRMNSEYELKPKLLETFNPDKGHVYSRFYKPFKEGKLPPYRVFIRSLPADNPYTTEDYKQQIMNSSPVTVQRLWYGNFEYDNDPTCLIEFDAITDIFSLQVSAENDRWLTVDVARMGMDKTVMMLWDGLQVIRIWVKSKQDTVKTATDIMAIEKEHGVRRSHVIVDEAGVGGGVVDQLKGCVGFIGGAAAVGPGNYKNLRSECYFLLAQHINAGKLGVNCPDPETRQAIIQELEQVKQRDPDKDSKLAIIEKDIIKQNIGRSPDYSDTLSMRFIALAKPKKNSWVCRTL